MEIYDFFVTTGCSQNPLRYCPDLFVTREQMAKFIVQLFEGSRLRINCDSGATFTDVTAENVVLRIY